MEEQHGRDVVAVGGLLDEEHVDLQAILVLDLHALVRKLVVARLQHKHARVRRVIRVVQQQVLRTVKYP